MVPIEGKTISSLPSKSTRGTRIAVVGAGPGGLAAGIALQQAGFDVKIFERHKQLRSVGGAVIVNAVGKTIMSRLGASIDEYFVGVGQMLKSHDGRERVRMADDEEFLRAAGAGGWCSGMMRSDLTAKLLGVVPEGMIVTDRRLLHYSETGDEVILHFEGGSNYTADVLIGADGIDSVVRQQMFGGGPSKHLGINVWLGWAAGVEVERGYLVVRHADKHMFGYAPLRFQGQDCVEWWFVEPSRVGDAPPSDMRQYIGEKIKSFESPVGEIFAKTDVDHNLFRWPVKWRDPLSSWSRGRVTLLGDACHPTSPYAGYGLGMAIEDGYFLGQDLAGRDLSDPAQVAAGFALYESQRVAYTNKVTSDARSLGRIWHNAPWISRRVRNFMIDHTRLPAKAIKKQYTKGGYELLDSLLAAERAAGVAKVTD